MTDTLRYFLEGYLSVVPDGEIGTALRQFARSESPERVLQLRRDLQEIMESTSEQSLTALNQTVRLLANYDLPNGANPIVFLTKLWEQAQLVGPWEPFHKPYDVFITHVQHDEPSAKRVASELSLAGFKAWYDEWEDQSEAVAMARTSHALRSADCVVVLISKASLALQWYKKELEALFRQGRSADVEVVLVYLDDAPTMSDEAGQLAIRIGTDWTPGINSLLRVLELLRSRQQLNRQAAWDIGTPAQARTLEVFYRDALHKLSSLGWPKGAAYKDVVIGPSDDALAEITLSSIHEIIRDCRVALRNWGGASFPYDETPQAKVSRGSDGISLVDDSPWPSSGWSFNFWHFTPEVRFVHRTDISEDNLRSRQTGKILAVEWALKDICCPLMFAQRVAIKLHHAGDLVVGFNWRGLSEHRLAVLNTRKVPILRRYVSTADEFTKQVTVRHDSDLFPIAEAITKDLFWLFGWDHYPEDEVGDEIRTLLSGSFPR